jgi:hypothetical protein
MRFKKDFKKFLIFLSACDLSQAKAKDLKLLYKAWDEAGRP